MALKTKLESEPEPKLYNTLDAAERMRAKGVEEHVAKAVVDECSMNSCAPPASKRGY